MKIKRIFASLSAQVDSLVSNMENHEAVAECAIADASQYTAKLNAQLQLNSARAQQCAAKLDNLDTQIAQWQARALRCGESDRDRALQCLQAKHQVEQQRQQLLEQLSQTQSLEVELRNHLQAAEQQLATLRHKKSILTARDARNQVISLVHCDHGLQRGADDLFVRWEEKVMADEYIQGIFPDSTSQLDANFLAAETRGSLHAELDELLAANRISQEEL